MLLFLRIESTCFFVLSPLFYETKSWNLSLTELRFFWLPGEKITFSEHEKQVQVDADFPRHTFLERFRLFLLR